MLHNHLISLLDQSMQGRSDAFDVFLIDRYEARGDATESQIDVAFIDYICSQPNWNQFCFEIFEEATLIYHHLSPEKKDPRFILKLTQEAQNNNPDAIRALCYLHAAHIHELSAETVNRYMNNMRLMNTGASLYALGSLKKMCQLDKEALECFKLALKQEHRQVSGTLAAIAWVYEKCVVGDEPHAQSRETLNAEAMRLYQESIIKGNGYAYVNLAMMHLAAGRLCEGQNQQSHYGIAAGLLKDGIRKGNPSAMYMLARMYLNGYVNDGQNREQHCVEALGLFYRLLDRDNYNCFLGLATMHMNLCVNDGRSLREHLYQAVYYLRKIVTHHEASLPEIEYANYQIYSINQQFRTMEIQSFLYRNSTTLGTIIRPIPQRPGAIVGVNASAEIPVAETPVAETPVTVTPLSEVAADLNANGKRARSADAEMPDLRFLATVGTVFSGQSESEDLELPLQKRLGR